MTKIKGDIKAFIDEQLKSPSPPSYSKLAQIVSQRFGMQVSKATLSRQAKALNLGSRSGRKRLAPRGKKPPRSIFLDCAGAFFLKGAELEMGLLATVNRLLVAGTESAQAQRVLKLAQQINALLLYAPVFDLKNAQDIAGYQRRGLLYLAGLSDLPELPAHRQAGLPTQEEISQYLDFLAEQKLLLPIIKEVAKACVEAQFIQINFAGEAFYLDAQTRTVWPSSKIPHYFGATLNETRSCIRSTFLAPSPQRPLILQTCPGYTSLPAEMFNFIRCLEQAQDEPISRIVIADRAGEPLSFWQNLRPAQKCFFIAPLSPWQYARLQGTKIIKDFKQYHIGPEKEPMSIADAQTNLFDTQPNTNIRVRAALVRRKEERLALITNISRRQERYIRRLVEQYFYRWPNKKLPTYYDILEQAHQQMLERSQSASYATPSPIMRYDKRPQEGFRLLLGYLHRAALARFLPSEYASWDRKATQETIYRQPGFLKIKRNSWEITLRPFSQKKLQKDVQIACQRFNQSGIQLPTQKILRISL